LEDAQGGNTKDKNKLESDEEEHVEAFNTRPIADFFPGEDSSHMFLL
jgi:hypothetical protein